MKSTSSEPLVLDVRPIFKKGGSPCESIDQAVAALKPGQLFVLLVPFEPHPLFAKLAREGFSHKSMQTADGSWRVEFQRVEEKKKAGQHACGCHEHSPRATSSSKDIWIDAREMEPPEPLVKTLEALNHLSKGARLFMHSNRKPMHLFTQLEERGFAYDCNEQPDHTFITEIQHL